MAPKKNPLEKEIPMETIIFRGYVSFREYIIVGGWISQLKKHMHKSNESISPMFKG